jgi:hypothetical protein
MHKHFFEFKITVIFNQCLRMGTLINDHIKLESDNYIETMKIYSIILQYTLNLSFVYHKKTSDM